MKIIFLDYDGVVNTPIWDESGKCGFNFPSDGKVNNYQAIMWLNELCKKTDAKIVVSSTWRYCCHKVSFQDCLYNAGLNKNIEIIGCTPFFGNSTRTEEIKAWLNNNTEINEFVILDDDEIEGVLKDKHVKCDVNYGIGLREFRRALDILGEKDEDFD